MTQALSSVQMGPYVAEPAYRNLHINYHTVHVNQRNVHCTNTRPRTESTCISVTVATAVTVVLLVVIGRALIIALALRPLLNLTATHDRHLAGKRVFLGFGDIVFLDGVILWRADDQLSTTSQYANRVRVRISCVLSCPS